MYYAIYENTILSYYNNINRMDSIKEKLNKIEIDIYSNPLFIGLIMLIQFIIFLVIVYKYNPYYDPTKPNDHQALTQFIVLIVGFLYVILFMFLKEKLINKVNILSLDIETPTENSFLGRTIATLLFFIIFVLLTISIVWIFSNLSIVGSIISHGLIILLVIFVIILIYIGLKKSVDKLFPQNGFLSFLKNFILFIPCLLIRFAEYIKYEYKITGKPVWILLIVEIILILLWVIIPIIFRYYFDKDGSKLLDGPVYLNKKRDIGNFENLHKKI